MSKRKAPQIEEPEVEVAGDVHHHMTPDAKHIATSLSFVFAGPGNEMTLEDYCAKIIHDGHPLHRELLIKWRRMYSKNRNCFVRKVGSGAARKVDDDDMSLMVGYALDRAAKPLKVTYSILRRFLDHARGISVCLNTVIAYCDLGGLSQRVGIQRSVSQALSNPQLIELGRQTVRLLKKINFWTIRDIFCMDSVTTSRQKRKPQRTLGPTGRFDTFLFLC